MSLRSIIADLSAADVHWNIEAMVRAADALEWIVSQPTSPNDPRPVANWWDLYRAAQYGLGLIHNPPAATGGTHVQDHPVAAVPAARPDGRAGDVLHPGRGAAACHHCEDD